MSSEQGEGKGMGSTRGVVFARKLNEYTQANLGRMVSEKVILELLRECGMNGEEEMMVKARNCLNKNGIPFTYNQMFNNDPFEYESGMKRGELRGNLRACSPMWKELKEKGGVKYMEFIRHCDELINEQMSPIYERNMKELNEYMRSKGWLNGELRLPSREGRYKRINDMKAINYILEVNGMGMKRMEVEELMEGYGNRVNVGTWCEEDVASNASTPSSLADVGMRPKTPTKEMSNVANVANVANVEVPILKKFHRLKRITRTVTTTEEIKGISPVQNEMESM